MTVSTIRRHTVRTAFVILTTLAAGSAMPLRAMAEPTKLILTADGEVSAAPDQVTLNFGVSTDAASAKEAIRLNREQMTTVLASLKGLNVPETDIMTSGINLKPRRAGSSEAVKGYTAVNSVAVRFSDVTKAGAGMDAIVEAGVNQIRNLNFGFKDSAKYQDEATALAVRNLMAKADLFASATGKKVKSLSLLTDGTVIESMPDDEDNMVVVTGYRATTPVMAGQAKIKVTVKGQFEIE